MSYSDEKPGGAELWAGEPEMHDGIHMKGPGSTVSSGPSMQSDWSREAPPYFKQEGKSSGSRDSGVPSSESASSASVVWEQCDVCFDTAVKICMTCMASYCLSHVKDHYRSPDLQTHQLENFQHQGVCDQHHKQHEFYCRTDQSAICSHCLLHNHREHDVIEQIPQEAQSKREGVSPPGQIQFTSVQSDSVTLSWSPPEGATEPLSYRVTRRRGQELRSFTVAGLGLEVTGLTPGETYHFAVASLSADGYQGPSVKRSVRTEVPPPEDLSVDPRSLTASLKWTKPAGVDQVSYLLELFRDQEHINTISRDDLHQTITGLQYGTDYTIRVSTVLSNGLQSKPTRKTFTTEVPPPEDLSVDLRSLTASLKWTKPAGVDQVSYLLELFRDQELINTISRDAFHHTITGLQYGTDYTIRVSTVLSNGRQSKPTCKTFTTEEVRIVLLGKTGVGKSDSGNTILGRKAFRAQGGISPVTLHCQMARGEVDGRRLCVIDTPCPLHTCLSEADIRQEIERCISMSSPGPHVFLLVATVGRFTREEQEAVKIIQSIYGQGSAKYTIVLLTRGDDLEADGITVDDFISNIPSLRELVDQCSGGHNVFNNRQRNNHSQVRELLYKIDKMVALNGGNHYTIEQKSDTHSVDT